MSNTIAPNGVSNVKFKFDISSLKAWDIMLTQYQNAIDILEDISLHPEKHIGDMYGICNNGYKLRYVTPHDVSTFVSYIGKIATDSTIVSIDNVNDMETIATSLIQRFVNDNEKCIPFESTTVYGNQRYINQRSMNLDQLMLISRNEFYDTSVYSKSDMINRAIAIRYDVNLMKTLRFPLNMRKLINRIPEVLNQYFSDGPIVMDTVKRKSIIDIIQRFINTVCVINLASIEQMMGYCIPAVYYNNRVVKDDRARKDYDYYKEYTKFSDGIVTESVDLSKNKPVFISLSTGGDNFVSNTIRNVTGEPFSHSSISFDPNMEVMYTFNGGPGLDDVYGLQKPGFQRESLHSSKFNDVPVRVYCVFVSNETFDKLQKIVEGVEKEDPGYDYKAIADRWRAISTLGPNANPSRGDGNRQVCSTFVNSILSCAGDPLGSKEITSPGELDKAATVRSSEVFKLFDGPGKDYDGQQALAELQDIANREDSMTYASKPYVESFYTECCLLKTNEIGIRSKIPFNCNMRDVVLQDMHPNFKDTISAIMFILTDPRSPISSLVRKYKTIDRMDNAGRVLNTFMHLRHSYGSFADSNETDPSKIPNSLGMHTDVNWLDKITYGNQFLDGNYRADALGNNRFNPMEQTLSHLYSMYNCESLKDNESLANNIVEVANAMNSIIHEYSESNSGELFTPRTVLNWDMVRDILAVLGEIMTRSMLKLYHNNTTVISISDDIGDGEAPGYMYTESFEMFLEATATGPSITVNTDNKTGAKKVLGNIKMVIQKFIQWVSQTIGNLTNKFTENHQAELNWVKSHAQLNTDIGNAIQNGFKITLNNYKPYKIQVNMFKNNVKISEIIKNAYDKGTEMTSIDIFKKLLTDLKLDNMPTNDIKELQKYLKNYFLFNEKGTTDVAAKTTELTPEIWKDITDNILQSTEGFKTFSESIKQDLEAAGKFLNDEAKNNDATNQNDETKEEQESFVLDLNGKMYQEDKQVVELKANVAQPKPTTTTGTPPGGTSNKSELVEALQKSLQDVSGTIDLSLINAYNNEFYKNNYKLYRDIVTAYKSQYEPAQTNSEQQDASAQTPANK